MCKVRKDWSVNLTWKVFASSPPTHCSPPSHAHTHTYTLQRALRVALPLPLPTPPPTYPTSAIQSTRYTYSVLYNPSDASCSLHPTLLHLESAHIILHMFSVTHDVFNVYWYCSYETFIVNFVYLLIMFSFFRYVEEFILPVIWWVYNYSYLV